MKGPELATSLFERLDQALRVESLTDHDWRGEIVLPPMELVDLEVLWPTGDEMKFSPDRRRNVPRVCHKGADIAMEWPPRGPAR
jgi:hypothetical protein